jgi:hypothetical protein
MPKRDEIPVELPTSLVEQARELAASKNCSIEELLREALLRYREHDQHWMPCRLAKTQPKP